MELKEFLDKCPDGSKKDIFLKFKNSIEKEINTGNDTKVLIESPGLKNKKTILKFIVSFKNVRMLKVKLADREDNNIDVLLYWTVPETGADNNIKQDFFYLLKEHNIDSEKIKEIIINVFETNNYEVNIPINRGKATAMYSEEEDRPITDIEDFKIKTTYKNRDKLVKCLVELTNKLIFIVDFLK